MGETQAEKDATTVFDALYRDYLLRDFFAKIVPGGCLIYAAAYATERITTLLSAGVLTAVFVAGLSWTIGFAAQQVGETLRILKHHPTKYSPQAVRYKLRIEFARFASREEENRVERHAVIKEATGNTATAFLAGLLFILVGRRGDLITVLPVTIAHSLFVVAAAAILIAASRSHAQKEYRYMEDVVAQGRSNERDLA